MIPTIAPGRAALALLLLAACGGGTLPLKPQHLDQPFAANSLPGGTCPQDGPLGTVRYDVAAFNDSLGVDRNTGCLMPGARFGFEAWVLQTTQGDSCSVAGGGARGVVTIQGFEAAYDWIDGAGASATERYTLACPDTVLDLGGEWDALNGALNGCLARVDEAGHEFFRKGYNRRAPALDVTALGRCSADVCFHVELKLRIKLLSGSAALDGCP